MAHVISRRMPPGCADDAVGLEDVVEPWVKGLLTKLAAMAAPASAAIAPVSSSTEVSASSAGDEKVAPTAANKNGSVATAEAGPVETTNTEIATTSAPLLAPAVQSSTKPAAPMKVTLSYTWNNVHRTLSIASTTFS